MLIIGVDTHKHRNVAAAVAATGRPGRLRRGIPNARDEGTVVDSA